jgi:hypothetical protein
MQNDRFSYAQSFPDYGFSTNVAVGLGEDIQNDVEIHSAAQRDPNLALADPASVATAMGLLLGVVDSTITYQFLRNGSVLPQGLRSSAGLPCASMRLRG